MSRRLLFVAAAIFILTKGAPAEAVPIAATDFDTLALGVLVASSTDTFDTGFAPQPTTGTIEDNVYLNGALYTYTHTITPTLNNISEFFTGFAVQAFNGIAGFSFSDADNRGCNNANLATCFNVDLAGDGSIHWLTNFPVNHQGWDHNEEITFFFQSTLAPGLAVADYVLKQPPNKTGVGQSFAPTTPVPEPLTLVLLGIGFLGSALVARRRRYRI